MDCRTRPWLIEPSNGNKFLYVRLKAIFLRKYNPKKASNTSIAVTSSYRCETNSRAVLTTSEGKYFQILMYRFRKSEIEKDKLRFVMEIDLEKSSVIL